MSKRFKGKTCVYCAGDNISDTGDHVFAREFVAVIHRWQIPKVPACTACNREKADLEHYAATILLFGGRHGDAAANLTADGRRRLAKNQKLHHEMATRSSRIWERQASGVFVSTTAVPIDGARIEKLVGFIVRGLVFHHWGVILGPENTVDVHSLTRYGEQMFEQMRQLNAKQRVQGDIGSGALVYIGAQGLDNPAVSFWEMSWFGGAVMTSDSNEGSTSRFGIMTGPRAIKDRALDRIARKAFIIRP